MEETLISFETAKLAKEKGFKLQSNAFGYVTKFYNHNTHSLLPFGRTGRTDLTKAYYASTQGLLQKWLREVHNIYLTVIPVGDSGYELRYWYYSILGVDCKDGQHGINRFQTYEEALEAGLLKALKLVK